MHYTHQTTTATPSFGASLDHADYLRISQTAKTMAQAARREAVRNFWAEVADRLHNLLDDFGRHASVRLGAGHNVTRMEAS